MNNIHIGKTLTKLLTFDKMYYMSKTTYIISMTSKGTFTLPAKVRKELGLNSRGDKLLMDFSSASNEITIKKPADIRKIQKENAKLVPKNLAAFNLNKLRQQRHEENC